MQKRSEKPHSGSEKAAKPAAHPAPEFDLVDSRWSFLQNNRLVLAIVISVTAAVYLNALSGQFLYDDWFQIERNQLIRSWGNTPKLLTQHVWEFAREQHVEVSGRYYRPFFNLALLVNYQLFGLNEIGWHIVSLLLHLAATALVFFLAREWDLGIPVAGAASLIFGVHPIHVEAVAWASALPDLMVATFGLASILFYERARTRSNDTKYLVLSLISAFLAMGSKETGVMLPLFVVVRELIAGGQRSNIRTVASRSFPFIGLAIFYMLVRYWVIGHVLPSNTLTRDITLFQALLSIPPAIAEYLRLLLFPVSLSVIYEFSFVRSIAEPRVWIGLTVLIAMIAGLYVSNLRGKTVYLCLSLFFVFLLPALHLRAFSPLESLINDRYVYLASSGFCMLVAVILARLSRGSGSVFAAATLTLGLILGLLTITQNRVWRDDTSMTENAVHHAPSNAFIRMHLGEVYEDNSRFEDAELQYRTAIELEPDRAAGYLALANFLNRRGRTAEAEPLFEKSIALGSDLVGTWLARGGNYLKEGNLAEAEKAFKEAVRVNPQNAAAHYNLGVAYDRMGQVEQAESEYKAALRAVPHMVEAHSALAVVLIGQNRIGEAMQSIEYVRSVDPENIAILYPTAAVYLKQRQCGAAVEALTRFLSENPNHDRALILLGFGNECLGRKDLAIQAFSRAIEAAPNSPTADVARRRLEQLR